MARVPETASNFSSISQRKKAVTPRDYVTIITISTDQNTLSRAGQLENCTLDEWNRRFIFATDFMPSKISVAIERGSSKILHVHACARGAPCGMWMKFIGRPDLKVSRILM